jgi:hypothetical protein
LPSHLEQIPHIKLHRCRRLDLTERDRLEHHIARCSIDANPHIRKKAELRASSCFHHRRLHTRIDTSDVLNRKEASTSLDISLELGLFVSVQRRSANLNMSCSSPAPDINTRVPLTLALSRCAGWRIKGLSILLGTPHILLHLATSQVPFSCITKGT